MKSTTQQLSLALVFGWALFFSPLNHALTEEEKAAQMKALRETIAQVKKELESVKSDHSEMLEELEASETRIGELNQKVEELKSELEDKQSRLKQLRDEQEALALVKKQQTQAAATHLDAAYRLGRHSTVKMLLNQQDPASFSRNLKYFDYIVDTRNRKITELLATLNELDRLEPTIAAEVDAIRSRRETLAERRNNLTQHQQKRRATLKQLEAALNSKGDRLLGLERDRSELQSVVTTIVRGEDRWFDPETPFASLKGNLPWPAQGKVLRAFGSERVKGKMRWQGILIEASEGTPVRAVHAGRVVFADYLRGQGLLIIVDHGGGFMSLYAHNQSLFKKLGDRVAPGERIATVGLSGGQTTASLYFELRFKGEPTNPRSWLKQA